MRGMQIVKVEYVLPVNSSTYDLMFQRNRNSVTTCITRSSKDKNYQGKNTRREGISLIFIIGRQQGDNSFIHWRVLSKLTDHLPLFPPF